MKNWPVKKLGEVAEFLDNLRKPVTASQRNPGPYPYYGANGQVGWIDNYIFDEDLILLAEDGGNFSSKTRPIAYKISGKTWVNNHAHVLRPKEDFVDIDWLYFNLMFADVSKFIKGATRAKLNQTDARQIEIPVPGIEEQKKIVKKLEKILAKIDQARTLRQESIEKPEAVIRSALKTTFDDLSKKYLKKEIKDFGEVKGGKRLPAGHTFASLPTEYPYLRVVDFKDYSIDTSNMKYLGAATQQEISRYTISDQDAYISIAGTIGTVGTIPPQLRGANLTENAAKIVFSEEVNKRFVVYFLDSPQGKEEIRKRTNQVGQPKLALMRIETIEIPLPDLNEQEKVVEYLDSLSEKVQTLQKLQQEQLRDLEALQQSVLYKAFQGELVG